MLDIKLIRENPEKINELLKRRNPNLSIDEVIQIDTDKYKSIKFRHTYYTSADFNFSLKDTEIFVRQKYNLTMWSFSL